MKRILLSLIALALCVSYANAQSPVYTKTFQSGVISPASASITTTNTFQNLFPSSVNITSGREDCIIQNQGLNRMLINFALAPTATISTSMVLAAGATFRCANSGIVIKDAISITGTAGDPFFAAQE